MAVVLAMVLALGPASILAKGGDAKCPGSVAGVTPEGLTVSAERRPPE